LEVVVGSKDAWWPCWVKEYGAGGKPVGSVICDSTAMLATYLARTYNAPASPKTLRVTSSKDAPADRVEEVVKACHAAGFKSASVRLGSAGGLGYPPADRDLPAAIDRQRRYEEAQRGLERAFEVEK